MRRSSGPGRTLRYALTSLVHVLVLGTASSAWAELLISQIIISGNRKTTQARIERIMGLHPGDRLTFERLERARQELARAQIFENIRVEMAMPPEKAGAVMYVANPVKSTEVYVFLKEKHSWLGFPFGSASADNRSLGAVFLDQNFIGTTQKFLAAGQWGNQTSYGFISWRNPALFGSKVALDVWGLGRRDNIPFYRNHRLVQSAETLDFGGSAMIGGYWTRDFSTWIGGSYRRIFVRNTRVKQPHDENFVYFRVPGCDQLTDPSPRDCFIRRNDPPEGGYQGNDIQLRIRLVYDNRDVENEVYRGTRIQLDNTVGDQFLLSSFDFLQFVLTVEQHFRYAKRWSTQIKAVAGLSYATGTGGIPVMTEFAVGGTDLRGSFFREFRGDTVLKMQLEQQARLVNFWRLSVRGALFYDIGLVYSRHPQGIATTQGARVEDLHHGIGGGFRFFVRGLALPALAFDVAYGIDVRDVAFYFSVATGGL